jgi:hypothetical protein
MNELIPLELQNAVLESIKPLMEGATISSIETFGQADNASALLSKIKMVGKEMAAKMESLCLPHNYKKELIESDIKNIKSWFKGRSDILLSVESNIKVKIYEYQETQKRIAEEKNRAAAALAKKERDRIEAEARELKEKERILLEEAARKMLAMKNETNEIERKKLEESAARDTKKAEATAAKAEEKIEISAMIVADVVSDSAPKISGFYSVVKYSGEVVDIGAFASWCSQNKKFHLLKSDDKKLDQYIKSSNGIEEIPGVKIIKTVTQAQRQR